MQEEVGLKQTKRRRMGKKRKADRLTNPQPFLLDDDSISKASSMKRCKATKKSHQPHEKVISSKLSSKILKEALLQQREVDEEEIRERNPNALVFNQDVIATRAVEEDDDGVIDNFTGFQDQFGDLEDQVNEEEERLLESFFSTDNCPQRKLADVIIGKIKEKDAQVSSGVQPLPKFDGSIIELYKGVGKFLNKYTSGKMPKAFKVIPSKSHWEELMYLTEPEKWSPNAMYQATRIFASNLDDKKAERFYKFVLLPRVRDDIRKNKRLHFALYQSLKKSIYKSAAFSKGILLPLCESCTLREAVIVGSVIQKGRIAPLYASAALLIVAEMEYCGTRSYFIKLLIEKNYALPFMALRTMVAHFRKFFDESRVMPSIWHLSLLVFVQRYKTDLQEEEKAKIRELVERQRHDKITPEILREIDWSTSLGEKVDDRMSTASPLSVINKAIEEDRFDIPEVPMEDD